MSEREKNLAVLAKLNAALAEPGLLTGKDREEVEKAASVIERLYGLRKLGGSSRSDAARQRARVEQGADPNTDQERRVTQREENLALLERAKAALAEPGRLTGDERDKIEKFVSMMERLYAGILRKNLADRGEAK